MTRRSPTFRLFAAAVVLLLVGFATLGVMAAMSSHDADQSAEDEASARTDQAQAEADRRATLAAIGRECRRGNLPRDLRYLCVQVAQLRDQPDPDDPELQDAEVQEPEINDPDPDDPERQDPEVQDPESDDGEVQDDELQETEVQDPEIDGPDPDDPETQDPEIQDDETQDPEIDDPDPNDPQDPPASYTFNVYPGPGSTTVCTLDDGADPRNPTYTCTPQQP